MVAVAKEPKKKADGKYLTLKVHRKLAEIVNETATLRKMNVTDYMDSFQKLFEDNLLAELEKRKAELKKPG